VHLGERVVGPGGSSAGSIRCGRTESSTRTSTAPIRESTIRYCAPATADDPQSFIGWFADLPWLAAPHRPFRLAPKIVHLGSGELVGVRVFPDPYGDTRRLADGRYRLRVRVWDVAGNSAEADSDVTIRN